VALNKPILFALTLAVASRGQAEAPAKNCCGPCICVGCVQLAGPELARHLLDTSSELFFGTVIAEELLTCCDSRAQITFNVIRRWKGADTPQVRIRTLSCTEIYPFVLGRQYLVSASSEGGDPALLLVAILLSRVSGQRTRRCQNWTRLPRTAVNHECRREGA
jgi:hypothetical protein